MNTLAGTWDAGPALRELRERAGLTLRDLAQIAHTSWQHISLIERGEKYPRIDTYLRLLYLLGHTIAVVPVEDRGEEPEEDS